MYVAEEARQETVRKLGDSSGPGSTWLAERMVLSVLWKNNDLTILLADKGNATVVLNTVDYDDKIGALTATGPSLQKVAQDPTDIWTQNITSA
jgi:hypothetical protein